MTDQQVYLIDSTPLPVCHKRRAGRCTKVNGHQYWGYCAAKEVYFFGWKLHMVCTVDGVPVSFDVLPAAHHDLCPVQHLLAELPPGAWVLADKGYNSANDEQLAWVYSRVRLIPKRRRNMSPNDQLDARLLTAHRSMIETVYSQLEKMGIQR
jgi:IS5 family transposase